MPGALAALKKYAGYGPKDIELPLRKGEKPDPTIAKREGRGTLSNIIKGYDVAKKAMKK